MMKINGYDYDFSKIQMTGYYFVHRIEYNNHKSLSYHNTYKPYTFNHR